MAAGVLELRPPWWARLYVAVFSVVWCAGVLAGGAVALVHRSVAVVIPLLMLSFGGTLGYRLSRLAVIADREGLTVRNNLSTRRVAREDVEGFRVGSGAGVSFGTSIHVLLRGDTVLALDVTTEPYNLKRSRARLRGRLEELQRWQSG